jgi:ATP-dependent RNA helicase RhlE
MEASVYGKQREELKRGVDILVATPGRLLDLLEQRTTTLKSVEILVLDEVDRMLDMGFLPDVRRIVEKISTKRQTFAVSPPRCRRRSNVWPHGCCAILSWWKSACAVRLRKQVTHAVYPVAAEQKFDLLMALLERTNFDSALIFCRTKYGADRIAHQLKQGKHAVAVLHSNRTAAGADRSARRLQERQIRSDGGDRYRVRGLDIAGVSHVINYDVPEHPEDYVHRIGRTGRRQNVGDAFTLMSGQELPALQAIERFIGQKIPRLKLENFPYIYTALFEQESATGGRRGIGGGRTHRGYSFGKKAVNNDE